MSIIEYSPLKNNLSSYVSDHNLTLFSIDSPRPIIDRVRGADGSPGARLFKMLSCFVGQDEMERDGDKCVDVVSRDWCNAGYLVWVI